MSFTADRFAPPIDQPPNVPRWEADDIGGFPYFERFNCSTCGYLCKTTRTKHVCVICRTRWQAEVTILRPSAGFLSTSRVTQVDIIWRMDNINSDDIYYHSPTKLGADTVFDEIGDFSDLLIKPDTIYPESW